MKRLLLLLSSVFLIVSIMAVPVLASSSWHFTMNHDGRYIDGAKNGQFHSRSKGKVTISGSIWATVIKNEKVGPNNITFELRNKNTGNKFGTVTVKPNKNYSSKAFSKVFPKKVGGGKNTICSFIEAQRMVEHLKALES